MALTIPEARMADENPKADAGAAASATDQKTARRRIPGNLPYTGSAGVLQRVLEKIPISERPAVFTGDFLATVIGASGGAARPIIPILKATGLLNQSSQPTEVYSSFQTEGKRAAAAHQALRNGFSEIFKRNQYAHKADDKTLIDLIVAITGLPRNDNIVRYILNTFQAFQSHIKLSPDADAGSVDDENPKPTDAALTQKHDGVSRSKVGLVYNLNIVLPETTNIDVYDAIFRSLRSHILE